jgi:hypothetical protein
MASDSGRIKHYARVVRSGLPNIWVIIGAITIVVGGNLLITFAWGQKHFAWGIVLLLAVALVTVIEGSWQTEIANRAALAAERKAHLDAKAALEVERETPVSPGHREKLKSLVRKAEEQISGAWSYRYFDHVDPHGDVRAILTGHFPELVKLLDTWNAAVAEQDAAGTEVLRLVREAISENMSAAPWNPSAILDAFQERLLICDHAPGQDTPKFGVNLKVEEGKLTWRVTRPEPPDLYYSSSVFEIAISEGSECRDVFEAALTEILESAEFDVLKMAWQTVREVRLRALDALRKIEQSDEIYRRCSECRHP